jgi:hypothetical protein
MQRIRPTSCFRETRTVAVCILACFCVVFFALRAYAAAPAAPKKTRAVPSKSVGKPGWDFQAPDRSAQSARWRESLCVTLQQTTFAPAAPAGRYLQHNATTSAKRLPPAQMDDLDKIRPPENKRPSLGGKASMHAEITKESTGWRPHNDLGDAVGAKALREERRAGAYAGFHPGEDVELKLGPEYHLGASSLRPEQTGQTKDNAGALGMGMKLKIDF